MNANALLKQFSRISDTPTAVQRLKQFVLDLAVRGKLSPQDPQELPSPDLPDLLNQRLIGPTVGHPPNWILTKLGSVLNLRYGKGLGDADRLETGRVQVFGSNGVIGYCEDALSEEPAIIIGRKGSAGALTLSEGPSWTTDVAYYVIPPSFLEIRFLWIALQTLKLETFGKGVKPGLSRNEAYGLHIAIPPLPEQRRIVAKVDELMDLCERLGNAQEERTRSRGRLTTASLHHISTSQEEGDRRDHVCFYLNQIGRLTASVSQIKHLRNTVLDLAVTGKIVRHDPTEESGETLLDAIRSNSSKAAHRSKASTIDDSDPKLAKHLPKELPTNWTSCALEDLFRFIDYRGRTPERTTSGIRLITAKNVRMGFLTEEPVEFIDTDVYDRWMTRGFPKVGDLLFVTEGATMGYVGALDLQFKFALAQRTIDLQPYDSRYSTFYLFVLMTPLLQGAVQLNATGTAVKGIKAAKLKRIRIPVPPLAEQLRILAKVRELMKVCDELESVLVAKHVVARNLLEAVLHEALSPITIEVQ